MPRRPADAPTQVTQLRTVILQEESDDVTGTVTSVGSSETVNASGRSVHRQDISIRTQPLPNRQRVEGSDASDATFPDINEAHNLTKHIQILPKKRRRNNFFLSTDHDTFLTSWISQRDKFVTEMLRLEGLRGNENACSRCTACDEVYRCSNCIGGTLLCSSCCVKAHESLPFHVIKVWDGQRFVRTSLSSLRLTIQLGHPTGKTCGNPANAPENFMVLDANGWHSVTIRYCHCRMSAAAGTHLQQLLCFELFPATINDPATCATFRVLEMFHALTLQAKTTVYDFYFTLNNLTDNTGVQITWDRFKQLLRMVREWRHLKCLKRGGRGFNAADAAGTSRGELVIHCPACPRPGVNLPEGWEDARADIKFLYTLVIAVDANFRLKRRAVLSNQHDPALGSGWGYFVEDMAYREHVLKYADQEDISTCTGFAAIAQANTKYSKGYSTTGVGMTICARHGMILPNGVGDLQKGKRYCNMDYIVASALKALGIIPCLVISYDIVCQWALRFLEQILHFPANVRPELLRGVGELRYAIPKYHFCAHKKEGHAQYSLHYMPGVGRVCGEQTERTWPKHSETVGSTREMAPGSRHDTLEDHFGYTNWCVLVSLGATLRRQHKLAIQESEEQSAILDEFHARLEVEHVTAWEAQATVFEADPTQPDPYCRRTAGISEADVRLELVQEDNEAHAEGRISLHKVTLAGMVVEGLQIEDQQRAFREKYTPAARSGLTNLTTRQATEMLSKRTAMRRRIAVFHTVQAIYMPCAPSRVASHTLSLAPLPGNPSVPRPVASTSTTSVHVPDRPESEPLFLPNELTVEELQACSPGIANIEEHLCDAQLGESLDKLRVQLHVKARLVTFKNRHVHHQGPNTHARRLIDINEEKIFSTAEKYRAARVAKGRLSTTGLWEQTWRVLQPSDMRTMLADDDPVNLSRSADKAPSDRVLSESRRQTSWIWMAADKVASDDGDIQQDLQDAVWVEYLKARAHTQRCREQVMLIAEEKRRVLQTLEFEAQEWTNRKGAASKEESAEAQGRAAYVAKQAAVRRTLANEFATMWGKPAALVPEEEDADSMALAFRSFDGDDSDSSDESGLED